MLKILVDRTQKAGDIVIDKSIPSGPNEKFDISNAFLHGKETSAPRNRALFHFMNQACGGTLKRILITIFISMQDADQIILLFIDYNVPSLLVSPD